MPTYYCHRCAAARGYLRPPPTGPVIGNTYQLDKYMKHTVPDPKYPVQSVFSAASTEAYARYLVSACLAGSVELDDRSRTNVIWAAGHDTGLLYASGQLVTPEDAVKVVLTASTSSVHAFPCSARGFSSGLCIECGDPIVG